MHFQYSLKMNENIIAERARDEITILDKTIIIQSDSIQI